MDTGSETSKKRSSAPRQRSGSMTLYMAIAAGAFVCALGVLFVMLTQAERLVHLGLAGNLYYILLVPLGLAVAAFLFGVLRSYATYSGNVAGGSLELGGPIVAFLLVVILGFYLIPGPQAFNFTVFVHGQLGKQDLVLRNVGAVSLDFGGDRRQEMIGDKGQAFFAGIPSNFRGQAIPFSVYAPGYEPVSTNGTIVMADQSAYVAVRPATALFSGYVRSGAGEPIAGATVSISGSSVQTDASGFFRLTLTGAGTLKRVSIQVVAPGFVAWHSQVVPGGDEIAIALDRLTSQ